MSAPATTSGAHRFALPRPSRRELLAGSLLLTATAASQLLKPRRMFDRLSHDELASAIPVLVGEYHVAGTSGLILPPRDELSEKLYDQVVTRVYAAPGSPPVMALFAYGSVQNLSLELHRPDECYPQQGFAITKPEPLALKLDQQVIPASILTARRPDGYVEQVLFWSRIGTHFPSDRTSQSLLVARENFAGRMPDGLLARLSVPTADRSIGLQTATGFAEALVNRLSPQGHRILFGDTVRGNSEV